MNITMDTEKIIKDGVEQSFNEDEVIFHQGDQGKNMYLIVSGEVMLSANYTGNTITIATLRAGDALGEMALLENMPRSATATAVKPTILVSFTKEQLLNYISNEQGFAWKLLKKLSGRIRNQNKRLAETVSEELKTVSEQLNTSMKTMEGKIAEVATFAHEIEENERQLVNHIKEVQEITNEVNNTLEFITQIANQTRILGFNAMIEAARSGEHGKGFSIVAQEMTKLSELSKENAAMIKSLSEKISDKMQIVTEASEESSLKSQKQNNITKEMVGKAEEVISLSTTLVTISSSLRDK
ncbi:cyclic nucleotide-binding domain-containing protein [Calidifontibacillus oryziterrae]|uniref:cyclic nucleotide-binding domain-containing protein n=1 Tax=Calidifontibacillus oryziterrae TaxID=1191699 RepID=UPI0003601293|nr:cyclic nucleotide-binding domain-containing protein [Calidifontibacillus oryziterrae]